MRRVLVAIATSLLVAACSSGQDPGLSTVPGGSDGPGTTSKPLQACPPGGPDATTPPAGCVGEDGQVLH